MWEDKLGKASLFEKIKAKELSKVSPESYTRPSFAKVCRRGRLSPYAVGLHLKHIIVNDQKLLKRVFSTLS